MGCSAQDKQIERHSDHPTIVSLNPCADAILAQVTEPGQLLAISHYSHDPSASSMDLAEARKFAASGGTVEEVLALQPDIVVAGSFLAPATRQAFADLGVRVEIFGIAPTVEESKAQIERLAALAGNADKGAVLLEEIDLALDHAAADGQTLSAVLWQPGGIVPGEGALVSNLMRHTGFSSHSAARGMGQADYLSLEQMLVDPPEVLLLAGQERSQQHPALEKLSDTAVAKFDSSLLYCGGPTIIRAIERLAQIRSDVTPGKARGLRPVAQRRIDGGSRLHGNTPE